MRDGPHFARQSDIDNRSPDEFMVNTDGDEPAPGTFEIDRADLISGLGRGLQVIESFDDDHPRQSVAEVAQRTGIPRTAARRHLLSLCHFGYAATDGKWFWLTPRVLRLGQSYLGAARLPRLVQPFIQRVSMQCGETVNVSVLDGHEVVYVARSNPPRHVSIGYQVGVRVPAHVVTPGVVMLAQMSPARLARWIEGHDFIGYTAATVTDVSGFRQQIEEARSQDYWTTVGQLDAGLRGIAVALKDRHGRCVGAVSMTVQTQHYDDALVAAQLMPLLRETAQTLRPVL
jgi:IclR family pca regulon transcriptional regulator